MNITELQTNIIDLVEYGWGPERQDYKQNPTPNHIFCTLVRLDNFINGTTHTPEDFVA